MHDVVRFWLDRGVDGFRFDVAEFVMKHPDLLDNPPAAPGSADGGAMEHAKDLGDYDSLDHRYDKDHPDVHPLYRRMRRLFDEYTPPRVLIGEIHLDTGAWLAYYGAGLDEFQMPFNFRLLYADWEAEGVGSVVDGFEAALPEGAWPNWVLGNHDEPRLATRYGREHTRLAAMLLLTLRGTPTLYQGDELGLADVPIEPADQVDPWGLQVPGLGRDGCRTPLPWSRGPGGGFTAGAPWLPLGPEAGSRNVATQLENPRSLFNLYRALLDLRRRQPSLHGGGYRRLESPGGVLGYARDAEGSAPARVFLNFSAEPQEVETAGTIVLATGMDRIGEAVAGRVALRPREGVVLLG